VNRKEFKLVTKVILRFSHYARTRFRLSSEGCNTVINLFRSTRQGNVFLGAVCRDISCFIFKAIKEKELGMKIISSAYDKECMQ